MPQHGPILAVAQTASIRGDVESNIKTHARFAEAATRHGARFIIFPELSLTGYEPDIAAIHTFTAEDLRLKPLIDIARKHAITIVAGAPYRSPRGLHIAALVIQPEEVHVYTKHHLHSGEEVYFVPGTMGLQIGVEGERVSFAVCADTTHPEHAEVAARTGATVYAACVFITPTGIDVDSAQLRGYAESHRMTVLMANYASPSGGFPTAGRSAVWDKRGERVVEAPSSGEALLLVHGEGETLVGEVITTV
jgi:predicted amidohydrolase